MKEVLNGMTVEVEFEKGVGAGRPKKVVKLADGTTIPYKEWKKSQAPKGKRGRPAFPRDAEGKIIRPPVVPVVEPVPVE